MQRNQGIITLVFALALLAGCAGEPRPVSGPVSVNATPPSAEILRIQLAQVEGQPAEEDNGFGDLFPGDDSMDIEEDFDPFETVNRFIFAFNETLDIFILRPGAEVYRFLLPKVVRDRVQNFMRNLKEPVNFANHLFQGKDEQASNILARFALNTTVGLAGLFDVADEWGLEHHSEDFGQTLGSYGAGPGPYLVLPLFGPSSVRDGLGRGVDTLLSPWPYVLDAAKVENDTEILLGQTALDGIDTRSRHIETIDDLKRDSIDYYARLRSLYLQLRRAEIKDEGEESNTDAEDAPSKTME